MPIALVSQLHFSRSEFMRCLQGLNAEDAVKRLQPMNSISWIIGHLAVQEQSYWVHAAQQRDVAPDLHKLVGYGSQPNTPPLDEMLAVWRTVTSAADEFLLTLKESDLDTHFISNGVAQEESIGKKLLRNIYHYWFHTGEAHAARQVLGHPDLPQFVGDMGSVDY